MSIFCGLGCRHHIYNCYHPLPHLASNSRPPQATELRHWCPPNSSCTNCRLSPRCTESANACNVTWYWYAFAYFKQKLSFEVTRPLPPSCILFVVPIQPRFSYQFGDTCSWSPKKHLADRALVISVLSFWIGRGRGIYVVLYIMTLLTSDTRRLLSYNSAFEKIRDRHYSYITYYYCQYKTKKETDQRLGG